MQSSPGKKRKPPAHPNQSAGMDLREKDPKSTVKIFLSRYLARDPVWAEDCWYSSWCEDSQFIAELHVPCFNDKVYVGTWSLTQKAAEQSAAQQFINDPHVQETAQRLPPTMRSMKYWKQAHPCMKAQVQGRCPSVLEDSRNRNAEYTTPGVKAQ